MNQQPMSKGKGAKTSALRRVWVALGFGGSPQPNAAFKRGVLRSGCLLALLCTAWWFVHEVALQAEVFRLSQDGAWLTVEGVESHRRVRAVITLGWNPRLKAQTGDALDIVSGVTVAGDPVGQRSLGIQGLAGWRQGGRARARPGGIGADCRSRSGPHD